jgi:hypothetical protein
VARRERDILERAVRTVAEQAKNASAVVDEAHSAGLEFYEVLLAVSAW